MRHLIILSLSLIVLSTKMYAQLPFDVKISRGRIWVQKYSLNDIPIFNDEERDRMIANSVDTGTGSLTTANFTPVYVSTHALSIIEDMNNAGEIFGRSDVMGEIEKRMSSQYNLKKMAEIKSLLAGYSTLTSEGYVTTDQEKKLKFDFEKCKGRKNNPLP